MSERGGWRHNTREAAIPESAQTRHTHLEERIVLSLLLELAAFKRRQQLGIATRKIFLRPHQRHRVCVSLATKRACVDSKQKIEQPRSAAGREQAQGDAGPQVLFGQERARHQIQDGDSGKRENRGGGAKEPK